MTTGIQGKQNVQTRHDDYEKNGPSRCLRLSVHNREKKKRADAMLEVAAASERLFQQQFLDSQLDVLWESRQNGHWHGTTDNYIRVLTQSVNELNNRVTPTRLVELTDEGVVGSIVRKESST